MHLVKRIVGLQVVAATLVAACWLLPVSGTAGFKLHTAKKTKASFESGGKPIEVWEYTPAKGTGPFPGVLALYGLDGIDDEFKKTSLMHDTVCGKIAEEGFVVHLVHFFDRTKAAIPADKVPALKLDLHKMLLDDKNPPDPKVIEHYRAWMNATEDGLARLASDSNVVKSRLAVMGVSLGGFVATSLVVEKPATNVKAIVNVFGALPPQQFADVRAKKIKLPPVLIMSGEDDDVVPEKLCRDLLELLRTTGSRGAEAHFYSAGHVFLDQKRNTVDMDRALSEALPTAIRFLKRHLAEPK